MMLVSQVACRPERRLTTTTAKLSNARISAQKCRLVADQIRGLQVSQAMVLLTFSAKKSASIIKKLLESAIANAEHNDGADIDELKIKAVDVGEGKKLKRLLPRAKGRSNRIIKQTCNIVLKVSER